MSSKVSKTILDNESSSNLEDVSIFNGLKELKSQLREETNSSTETCAGSPAHADMLANEIPTNADTQNNYSENVDASTQDEIEADVMNLSPMSKPHPWPQMQYGSKENLETVGDSPVDDLSDTRTGENEDTCVTMKICEYDTPDRLKDVVMTLVKLERIIEAYDAIQFYISTHGSKGVADDSDLNEVVFRYNEVQRFLKCIGESEKAPVIVEKEETSTYEKNVSCEGPKNTNSYTYTKSHLGHTNTNGADAQPLSMKLSLIASPPQLISTQPMEWKQYLDNDVCKVWCQRYHKSRVMNLNLQGVIDAKVDHILSVFNEIDLYGEWIPYFQSPLRLGLRESYTTGRFGRVDQMAMFKVDFPWPFQNRDCCVVISAIDDLKRNNQIVVTIRTVDPTLVMHDEALPQAVPPPPKNTQRLYVDGCLVFKPNSPTSALAHFFWSVDTGLNLNDLFVSFFCKIFVKRSFMNLKKVCVAAAEGKHAERRQENRYLYGFVEDRLEEFNLQ